MQLIKFDNEKIKNNHLRNGGGRGRTLIFSYTRRPGTFFLGLGVKSLNFNTFWRVLEKIIFGGMKILGVFFFGGGGLYWTFFSFLLQDIRAYHS